MTVRSTVKESRKFKDLNHPKAVTMRKMAHWLVGENLARIDSGVSPDGDRYGKPQQRKIWVAASDPRFRGGRLTRSGPTTDFKFVTSPTPMWRFWSNYRAANQTRHPHAAVTGEMLDALTPKIDTGPGGRPRIKGYFAGKSRGPDTVDQQADGTLVSVPGEQIRNRDKARLWMAGKSGRSKPGTDNRRRIQEVLSAPPTRLLVGVTEEQLWAVADALLNDILPP